MWLFLAGILKMKYPKCNSELRRVEVKIAGAKNKAISYQCPNDDYFEFEQQSNIFF